MSKVICDVCGTSYPDTAAQCPICGFVCASAQQGTPTDAGNKPDSGGYTYVKGGRFSKSNVRRRNGGAAPVKRSSGQNKRPSPKKRSDSNKGLIITAAILALAIVAVVIFITLRYFIIPENEAKKSGGSSVTATQGSEKKEIACTGISTGLDGDKIVLKELGETADIKITIEPGDCTDQEIKVDNTNSSAVKADINDKTITLTALAKGDADITIRCGDQSCVVFVSCDFDPTLTLSATEIKLTYEGEKISIYPDDIKRDEISWSVDHDNVVTVSNGDVVAVGEGTAKIIATYKGQTAECTVICAFEDKDSDSDNTGSGNQGSESSGSFDPVVNGTGGGVSE